MHFKHLFIILVNFCIHIPFARADTQPIKVILDTDMGSDCDDVGALALLNEYMQQGRVEILGVVYSSGVVPYGAGIIDAINRYYGHSDIPIGANHDSLVGDPVDKMTAEKLAKDTEAFGHEIIHNTDVKEQAAFLRELLYRQDDTSVVYITIGHTKGLYDLMASAPDSMSRLSGKQLAEKKIKKWIVLGALGAHNEEYRVKDWNFFFNNTAKFTDYLVENFERPTYFIDAGQDVYTGKSLEQTPPGNIVRTAYRDWLWNVEKKTLGDQRSSWDLMAVLYAVEEPLKWFEVFDDGYLDFDPEKGCQWISSDSHLMHYFVLQKDGFAAEISDYLNALICNPGSND